ncbi:MAG: lipase family protein [Pseudomonadota bacterium]
MLKTITSISLALLLTACSAADSLNAADQDAQAGSLLDQQAIAADALIPGAASGITFNYNSTSGLDGETIIPVSGALYLPRGDAPEGGWPLIAWSHGTVGVGDACAPSTNGRSERDLTYLSNWLDKGYAIVASDYEGLGQEGLHPYLATRPMAYSNLDAIRAVQAGDFPVSEAVVVTGQSQGASAAIATAGFAADYAPEVELLAISATGVPFFPPELQQAMLTTGADEPNPNVAFNLYLLTLAELLDPEFKLEAEVDPALWPAVSKAYDQCIFELIESSMAAELTVNQLYTPEVAQRTPLIFEALAYPTLSLPVPAFIGSGEADTITPLPMQQAFVGAACAAGTTLEARVYPGASHDGGLLDSIPDVEAFVAKAFARETIASTCS